MKEQEILFETARLAKEKGFNWPCHKSFTHYTKEKIHFTDGKSGPFGWEKDEISISGGYFVNNHKLADLTNEYYTQYAIPTQSFLQKWLREEHHIHIAILPKQLLSSKEYDIRYYIFKGKLKKDWEELFETYEEALEQALIEALNLITSTNDVNDNDEMYVI